ncbi:DotI/IcmL family type IV secretion protein [Marinobacter sp.]|uniref:DotI/IcmL family type IV secretion protein n=1 Tax=Marinobacter sp. TaxID=50741 RepID=UPI00356B0CB1
MTNAKTPVRKTIKASGQKAKASPARVVRKKAPAQANPAANAPVPTQGPKTYKENQSRLAFVDSNLSNFFWALGLCIGSFVLFVMVFFWTPDHYNIPATDDYRLINLKPLSEQGDITDADARDFAAEAIEDVLSLSNLNPKANMNEALDEYFTSGGRKDFLQALEAAGDLQPLVSGRYSTLAEIQSVPVIEEYRLTNNRFTWVFTVPVRWQWYDTAEKRRRYANINVTMFIIRESRLLNSAGMSVDALVYGSGS